MLLGHTIVIWRGSENRGNKTVSAYMLWISPHKIFKLNLLNRQREPPSFSKTEEDLFSKRKRQHNSLWRGTLSALVIAAPINCSPLIKRCQRNTTCACHRESKFKAEANLTAWKKHLQKRRSFDLYVLWSENSKGPVLSIAVFSSVCCR